MSMLEIVTLAIAFWTLASVLLGFVAGRMFIE